MEECCGNCIHYNEELEICCYYNEEQFEVSEYDLCQITWSIGCFEQKN